MSEYDDLLARVRSGESPNDVPQKSTEYSDLLGQVRTGNDSVRQAGLYKASFANPASEAQKQVIAGQLKSMLGEDWAPAIIDPAEAQRRLRVAENDHALRNSPALAQKFLDTGYAARTFDDVKQMAEVERIMQDHINGRIGPIDRPAASWESIFNGLGTAFMQGAERARQGIRLQFADATNRIGMQDDALKKREQAQFREDIAQPAIEDPTLRGIYSGVQSTMAQVPGIAASILMRNPNVALGSMGLTTESEAYGKYRARGASGLEALVGGVGEGAVEVATEMLPMAFLVNRFGKAGAGEFLRGLLGREVVTEQVATVVQDALDTAIANPNKTWAEYLAERPGAAYQTFVATVTQAGIMGSINAVATYPIREELKAERDARVAQRSLQAEATLTSLIDTVAQTQTLARTPQDVADLISEADETGGTDVFINARQFATVFNQDPLAPAEALGVTPEVLNAALASNADITVPLATLATVLAQDANLRPIIEHTRVDPGDMSPADARLWQAEQGAQFAAEAEAVLAKRQADEVFQTEVQQVHDQVLAQLNQSRRFTPQVNQQYSAMVRDFYVTMADRAGMTVTEMAARYPLRVVAEVGAGSGTVSRGADGSGTGSDPGVLNQSGSQSDLLVQHNLSAENLLHAQRMGGIPVPSLAITNKDAPLTNFGEITLLGTKEMADPKGYAGTKVFGADIYSPRYPDVSFALSKTSLKQLNELLAPYANGREIYSGEIRSIEDLTQNKAFIAYMLKQTGKADFFDLSYREMQPVATEMLRQVGADEKIFQGYTYSGRRRYIDHTLENVVKILKKELRGGENFNYGVGSLRAKFTPQFRSIEQIRKAKDRLMDKAGFDAVKEEVDNELVRIAEMLNLSLDQTIEVMEDAPKMGVQRAIERAFDDYGVDAEITVEMRQDVGEFLTRLKNLPTQYFEAKILREVDLAEFAGAVVPEGVDPKVIEALQARGVKDIRTYKQGDEADRAAKIAEFEHLFFQGNRGSFDPGTNTIALLENADLSTFLHEGGHFFLEVMADMASRQNAPAQIRADFEKTLAWFGIQGSPDADPITTWNRMSLEEKRQYHEQWARGFEAYLFEGQAPSVEMQSLFQSFKQWMMWVYKSLTELKVTLTDDVRGVFDRMLASERAIQTAEAVRNLAPIFQTPEQAGMTAEEWAAYQGEAQQATATAVDELQTRSIRDMRWLANAKARKIKELQATAKEVRAQVQMDVRREVMAQPLYRAWNFLTGKPLDKQAKIKEAKADQNKVDPTKDTLLVAIAKLGGISKLQAVEEWGLDPKEQIPKVAFGKPIVRVSDGLSIDAMAEVLAEYGYLRLDENDKWDNREFEEMFFDAVQRGKDFYSSWGEEAQVEATFGTDPDANITLDNTPYGKLDTTWLKGVYGDAPTAPWRLLSALRMTSPDGLHPDMVANLFGFGSGDELVRRLAVAEDPKVVIEGMTDQRMLEQYGDLASPKDMELAAERAIHNDVRARMLARELSALRKASQVYRKGEGNVLLKAARQHAEGWLARQTVRNAVKSGQHTAAEARSAKAADDAWKAGDTAVAAQHKRDQLLNNQLARASLRAGDEVRVAVKYLKKFDKESVRKAVDPVYRDQIDQLLERFDLRQASENQVKKRASLAGWLAEQEAMGLDPVVDRRLVEEAQRQHYTTMTMEEFRGLVDTIKSIEHLGRLKNRLLTAKDRRDFAKVVAELSESIVDNANRDVTTINAITPLEKGAKLLRGFTAMHRKFASIVREMDGGKDGGPMWEYLVRSMNAAGDQEVAMRGEMSEKFAALFAGIKGIELNAKIFIADLGVSLRREELLAIALNSGNEGNVQRLLGGGINDSLRGVSPQQLMAALNQVNNQEWDFVEGVWAMIEANRPAIAAQEKALTGVEPKWVEPSPFTLESGRVIRGGYYPAKYNADMSTRSNELEAVTDLRQQMLGAAGRASTRKSYTEQRAQEVSGRPLRLDLGVIAQHINEVTHRLAWQSWLIDARRIIAAPAVDRAIRDHYGAEILGQMKRQLADIAGGDNGPTDALDRVMAHIRNGTTVAGMGWNIMTSLMQPIGLTQSIQRVGAGWIAKGLAQYIGGNPFKVTADVHERSLFMHDRAKTINREINDVLNTIRSERMSKVEASYFYLIQKFQQMVDVPTWLGAYEKAVAEGNNEARAVALADQAVIDSQGGGQLKDLAAVQRGGAGQKLFTNFYSFFNTTYNLAVEARRATQFTNPLMVGRLAADYLLLFTVPVIWSWALKEALRGDGDDDEEAIFKKLAAEQINYLLGSMVLVREIGSAISGFAGYQGPAGTRFFSEAGKLVKQVGQGDVDMALVKAAANTVGTLAHLPSGQVIKSVEGTVAVMDGQAGPQAVLVGPPLKN